MAKLSLGFAPSQTQRPLHPVPWTKPKVALVAAAMTLASLFVVGCAETSPAATGPGAAYGIVPEHHGVQQDSSGRGSDGTTNIGKSRSAEKSRDRSAGSGRSGGGGSGRGGGGGGGSGRGGGGGRPPPHR